MEELTPVWLTSLAALAGSMGSIIAVIRYSRDSRQSDDQNIKQDTIQDIQMIDDIKYIKKKIDDPDNGLSAIKKSADNMKLHCAQISTRIESQVKTNSEEIRILRRK